MNTLNTFAAPTGRLLLAMMFLMSGLSKIGNYAGTQGYMEAMGVPGALLPLAIALEALGGLAIILGWQTKIVSVALAGFCVVSAVMFHNDFSNQVRNDLVYEKCHHCWRIFIVSCPWPRCIRLRQSCKICSSIIKFEPERDP